MVISDNLAKLLGGYGAEVSVYMLGVNHTFTIVGIVEGLMTTGAYVPLNTIWNIAPSTYGNITGGYFKGDNAEDIADLPYVSNVLTKTKFVADMNAMILEAAPFMVIFIQMAICGFPAHYLNLLPQISFLAVLMH